MEYTIRNRKNKIKIRTFTKAKLYLMGTLIFFCLVGFYTLFTLDTGNISMEIVLKDFVENMKRIFLEPRLSERYTYPEVFRSLLITLALATSTTIFGGIVALFLSFYASENLSNRGVVKVVRIIISFIRSVPTILWVMIFSVVASMGVEAAVIGMSFHSVAYLVKAYSESIEEMDKGIIEALKASGASKWQIIFQGVLPSTVTSFLSWTFVRFEINFTNAVVVGAASGAGGIGFEMYETGTMYHDLRGVGLFVYMILVTAIILEVISYTLRTKYIRLSK